jgi:hypothetical protein
MGSNPSLVSSWRRRCGPPLGWSPQGDDAGLGGERVVEELADTVRFDDFNDYWNLQSQVGGPIALFISSLTDQEVRVIRAALEVDGRPSAPRTATGCPHSP